MTKDEFKKWAEAVITSYPDKAIANSSSAREWTKRAAEIKDLDGKLAERFANVGQKYTEIANEQASIAEHVKSRFDGKK